MASSIESLPVPERHRTLPGDPPQTAQPLDVPSHEPTVLGEPGVSPFLSGSTNEEYARFVEELCAEQAVLWERGEWPLAEVYFREHPHLADLPEAFTLIRGEIRSRQARGEEPALAEYVERFPRFASQLLAEFLPARVVTAENLPDDDRSVTHMVPPDTPQNGRLQRIWPEVPGYEILEMLGRGGMGVVYKARQKGLNRLVALKMIHHEAFGDLDFLVRFHGEAEAIARLQHPHIVQIFGLGTLDRGLLPQPYFSLEFVEGGDLRARLGGNPQPPTEAAHLVRQLAGAVHYAHERGIVHRDLKPANVLLTGEGQPKIADFGLAKVQTEAGADRALTQQGMVLGTPAYMAPEQATGKGEVGPAADVYALGVMLYEMLTGRCPFEGVTLTDTMELVRTQEPIPPRRFQPRVPRPLETICLKCLHKEPNRRYCTAQELADDLGRFLGGEPIRARPAGPLQRAWRWACRRPLVAGLLALVVVVTLAGLGGVTGALWYALAGWQEAETRRGEAQQQRRRAEKGERDATAARGRAEQSAAEARKERLRAEEEERKAKAARARAEQGEAEAKKERGRAEQKREEAEKHLYFSRIAQARLERQVFNVTGSERALDLCLPGVGETDRRNWEWFYLKRLNHTDLFSWRKPDAPKVGALSFSPDGRLVAVGTGNPYVPDAPGEVTVWDCAQGKIVFRLGHARAVYRLAFSPNSRLLATANQGGGLKVNDARTGRRRWAVTSPDGQIRGLAFTPEGTHLYAVSPTGSLDVYEVATGKRVRVPWKFPWGPRTLCLSPDGKVLAATFANRVDLHDVQTGKTLHRIEHGGGLAGQFAFSPDGRYLLTAEGNRGLLWEIDTGKRVQTFLGHTGDVLGLAYGPDGEQVATAGADRTVRIWDVHTGNERLLLRGHTGRVKAVAFHPDGHLLASGSTQPIEVKLWDSTGPQEQTTVAENPTGSLSLARLWGVEGVRFSPDGQRLLLAGRNGTLAAADVETGQSEGLGILPMIGHLRTPGDLAAFAPDGKAVAATCQEDESVVAIWEFPSGKRRHTFRHRVRVHRVSFSANGERLATVGMGIREGQLIRQFHVWEVSTGKRLLVAENAGLRGHNKLSGVAALSPDGRYLAFDEYLRLPGDRVVAAIRLVEVANGATCYSLRAHPAPIVSLAFSPDGRYLATGDRGGQVMVWDLRDRRSLYETFLTMRGPAWALAFHPDGTRLAAVCREQVYLWEVPTGQELLILRGAGHRSKDGGYNPKVVWSPDGTRLATTNWNRTVSVWDASELAGQEGQERRRRVVEARAFLWHLESAQTSPPGSTSQAFHHKALMKRMPVNAYQRILRGRYLAQKGCFAEAAEEYRLGFGHGPPTHPDLWREHALLRLSVGDKRGYRKVCREMYARYGEGEEQGLLARMAWACALAHKPGLPAKQLGDLSAKIDPPDPRWEPGRCLALGLVFLRRGEVKRARNALERPPRPGGSLDEELVRKERPVAGLWLVRALLYHRLGRSEEARAWLVRAEEWVKAKELARGETLPPGVSWADWLSIQTLMKEARAVLSSQQSRDGDGKSG
jgi:WD40 repeat protein